MVEIRSLNGKQIDLLLKAPSPVKPFEFPKDYRGPQPPKICFWNPMESIRKSKKNDNENNK